MKLQLALDILSLEESLNVLNEVASDIDIIEVGTPWIVKEGVSNVKKIKEKYPDKEVLADIKIMDGGKLETDYALDMGADIVTVMAVTNDETIKAVIYACHNRNAKTMVDMMNAKDLISRCKEVVAMGADYICIHSAVDTNKSVTTSDILKDVCNAISNDKVALAGGIDLKGIDNIVPYKPAIVICGSYIVKAQNRKEAAKLLKGKMI